MSSEFEEFEQESPIKRPYSQEELDKKVDALRGDLSSKMNKWADRIQVSMTFKPFVKRFEGEVWEENGKKWTMKGGIRQNLTMLDAARMPWWCPKCSKPMNHTHDRRFYYRKGICYNCTIDWEGDLRLKGLWDEYERRTVRENEKSFLRDEIAKKIDYMRTFKEPQLHFEDGRWEVLATKDHFAESFAAMEKDIEFMVRRLEVITLEEQAESANASTVEDGTTIDSN
jgi:hypothetical protein